MRRHLVVVVIGSCSWCSRCVAAGNSHCSTRVLHQTAWCSVWPHIFRIQWTIICDCVRPDIIETMSRHSVPCAMGEFNKKIAWFPGTSSNIKFYIFFVTDRSACSYFQEGEGRLEWRRNIRETAYWPWLRIVGLDAMTSSPPESFSWNSCLSATSSFTNFTGARVNRMWTGTMSIQCNAIWNALTIAGWLNMEARKSDRRSKCMMASKVVPLGWCQTMPHWGTSSEFQRGEGRFKTRHYVILHVFLRHTFLLPVEIRYTCLTEARRLASP